jgi:hypothetical protein
MGAEIVEVSEDSVLTLFTPAGYSSSAAFAVYVHCDELQIVEVPVGSCPVQIKILKRYSDTIQLGEIKKWEDRGAPATKPLPRGSSVFYADYTKDESPKRRSIHIYAPIEGNPSYTLVSFVDGKEAVVLYGDNVEISKKFAVVQVDYRTEGFRYSGGGTGASRNTLFLFTH